MTPPTILDKSHGTVPAWPGLGQWRRGDPAVISKPVMMSFTQRLPPSMTQLRGRRSPETSTVSTCVLICDDDRDFANPIEPSVHGGAKDRARDRPGARASRRHLRGLVRFGSQRSCADCGRHHPLGTARTCRASDASLLGSSATFTRAHDVACELDCLRTKICPCENSTIPPVPERSLSGSRYPRGSIASPIG